MRMLGTTLNLGPMPPKWLDFIFQGKKEKKRKEKKRKEKKRKEKKRKEILGTYFFFFSYRDTTWGSPIVISMNDYYKILSDLLSIVKLQDKKEKKLSEQLAAGLS